MTAHPRTALITGASSGIGEAFARELHTRGWRCVLVARRAAHLEQLAAMLAAGPGAEVLSADLTDPVQLATVEDRLADGGLPVDLLVNNAAVNGIGPLVDQDPAVEQHKIDLNVLAPVRLSRAALPGMLARGRGGIVNVASVSAFTPAPLGATYAASKAFLVSFSESLHAECRRHGVTVTALCPGFTAREEGTGAPSRRLVLDRFDVARQGLDAVTAGRPLCVPGRSYRGVVALTRLLPRPLVRRAFERLWDPDRPLRDGT